MGDTATPSVIKLLSGQIWTQLPDTTLYGSMPPEQGLLELAQALAVSPFWQTAAGAALVVRQSPNPSLAVVGEFDAATLARLEFLSGWLPEALATLHYISYAQVSVDCDLLAAKLQAKLGAEQLQQSHFTAIPRGGLIVLGQLAYALQLKHKQLEGTPATDVPLVVVDDCALTGARFADFLAQHPHNQVIFACLYAHPDLRQAIEYQEQQVLACVSAHDMVDYAPQHLGTDYESWKQKAWQRNSRKRYWVGHPPELCFPWNEPDHNFWNPVTEELESGWYLLPPKLCVKNRPKAGQATVSVQLQPSPAGTWIPGPEVIFGYWQDQLIVGNGVTGKSLVLSEAAADFWQALITQPTQVDALHQLATTFQVDQTVLQVDLANFIAALVDQGFLVNSI